MGPEGLDAFRWNVSIYSSSDDNIIRKQSEVTSLKPRIMEVDEHPHAILPGGVAKIIQPTDV